MAFAGFSKPPQERGAAWCLQVVVAAPQVFIRAHASAEMKVCGEPVSRRAIRR